MRSIIQQIPSENENWSDVGNGPMEEGARSS